MRCPKRDKEETERRACTSRSFQGITSSELSSGKPFSSRAPWRRQPCPAPGPPQRSPPPLPPSLLCGTSARSCSGEVGPSSKLTLALVVRALRPLRFTELILAVLTLFRDYLIVGDRAGCVPIASAISVPPLLVIWVLQEAGAVPGAQSA